MQVRHCNRHDILVALESISIISASKVLEHDAPKNNAAEGSYILESSLTTVTHEREASQKWHENMDSWHIETKV